eukprot:2836222-Amphidinium_carterae.1
MALLQMHVRHSFVERAPSMGTSHSHCGFVQMVVAVIGSIIDILDEWVECKYEKFHGFIKTKNLPGVNALNTGDMVEVKDSFKGNAARCKYHCGCSDTPLPRSLASCFMGSDMSSPRSLLEKSGCVSTCPCPALFFMTYELMQKKFSFWEKRIVENFGVYRGFLPSKLVLSARVKVERKRACHLPKQHLRHHDLYKHQRLSD